MFILAGNYEYFVLRVRGKGDPIHIEASINAVLAYARHIEPHFPELAEQLFEKCDTREMKKIKLIVIRKATGDSAWYKDLVGSLFLVSDCTSEAYLSIVKPIVGTRNQLQIDINVVECGVVFRCDVEEVCELDVVLG